MATRVRIVCAIWLCCCAWLPTCAGEVRCELALKDGKTAYRSGEPIVLQLSFVSTEPGVTLNTTTTQPPSPIDAVVLSPLTGVSPWMEEQARGVRYAPDYAALAKLEPNKPIAVSLVLNDAYRFDQPGHYTVLVRTRRAGAANQSASGGAQPITTNEVAFDVVPFPEKEEGELASSLERQIRSAANQQAAQQLASQLDYLAGDAATDVKLSLFLHPKAFYPFAVNVTRGLWIAHNRARVVSALEKAIVDPNQEAGAGSGMLETLVALKLSLAAPYEVLSPHPRQPWQPSSSDTIQADNIRDGYLHQIAESIQKRTGNSKIDAARTVFVALASRNQTNSSDFESARETLITHFSQVDEYNVDWLLNSYGQYLLDPRILPALQHIADATKDPMLAQNRAAALKQMSKIAPEVVPVYLAREACGENPAMMQDVRDLTTAQTLPQVDRCLQEKLRAEIAGRGSHTELESTLEYIARFADDALVRDVRNAYAARSSDWTQGAIGAAVTYLMRWDPKGSYALLEPWLPGRDPYGGAMMYSLTSAAYPPDDGLRGAFRDGFQKAAPNDRSTYAYALAQIGDVSDRAFLQAQLTNLRGRDPASFSKEDGRLEGELVAAILKGRTWETTDREATTLEQGCVSKECKERFRIP